MTTNQKTSLRLAVLAMLVKCAPQPPGRTALMKFAYLLQTVKGVPLGYRFELYNYGPYDAALLSDLSYATTLQAINASTVLYSNGGYGYEYVAQEAGYSKLCARFTSDLAAHQNDIRWVLDDFGADSASRLELIATIVFAEREMLRKRQQRSKHELADRVSAIKPYFSKEVIDATIDELVERNLILLDCD